MFPIKTYVSERRAANPLAQVYWHDGVYCPCCRTGSRIRHGSYRVFQRYRCENCERTFNDQTETVFEHFTVGLRNWFLLTLTSASTRVSDSSVWINVSYKTLYRRIQRTQEALDAPLSHHEGLVEIDEVYVKAG